jgi:formylglycine-generating enzyme required for sulfatase activity
MLQGMLHAELPLQHRRHAADFCAKLSQREQLQPVYVRNGERIRPQSGTGYRLPSEAEWEFACRAGTITKFWTGDVDDHLVRAAWTKGNSASRTQAVGELEANPFGLFDVHGNVWEWVNDGWDAGFYAQSQDQPAINPNSPFSTSPMRVFRGGSWYGYATECRSSHRDAYHPAFQYYSVGFRVALPVEAVKAALAKGGATVSVPQALVFHGIDQFVEVA